MARRRPLPPVTEPQRVRRWDAWGSPCVDVLSRYGPLGAANRRRQLGRSVRLRVGELGKAQTLLQAGADRVEQHGPSLGEALAQQMVITLSKDLLSTAANAKARVLGHVSWGGDGHQTSATFDVIDGTAIRVAGSFVRLAVELVEQLDDAAPTSDVIVGAFVGYGSISQRAPTLSDRAVTTDVITSADFVVPPFAVGFSVWANASCGIEFLDGTSSLYVGTGPSAQPIGTRGEVLPLPPCTAVRLTPSAVGPVIITWHLGL